jgi:hypothetical protein
MDALTFRVLTSKDRAYVVSLFDKCFDLPLEDLDISWDYRSRSNSFGFWKSDVMVGFVLGSYHRRSGNSLYIDYFALDESVRGNGLGTQILQSFLANFEGSVHLFPISQAIANWYVRNGFKNSNKGYYVYNTYKLRSSSK